jgi:hypothetical protein
LKEATGATWNTRVQFKSGMLLIPARFVVSLCNVEDEARWALSAVRSASVGVYQLDEAAADSPGLAAGLASLDSTMRRKGWERLVAVSDGGQNVVVYTDSRSRNRNSVRVCVGVVDGEELVVVSATVHPDALMPIIEKHLPKADHRL